MSKKNLNFLIMLSVLSLLVLNVSGLSIAPETDLTVAQTYIPHNPIHIDGNADFLIQADNEDWPGDGSPENPIIISGYSFAAAEHMLRVENSDIHFEFVGNQLDGLSYVWCGVACINAANGVIKDNYVQRAAAGIHVVTVENYTIQGNNVRDSLFGGIVVEAGSVNVTVKDNVVYENQDFGIHIGNPYGSSTSFNVTIVGNTVYENTPSGIRLLEAENCIVDGNEVYSNTLNGIVVEAGSHSINYNNVTDCTTGILVSNGNCTITRNKISHVDYALSIGTGNNTISKNELTNNEKVGLRFFHSYTDENSGSNNRVTGNVIANNSRWGLEFIANTDGNIVEGNYFFLNGDTCQGTDDGTNNLIDANYWDDWTIPDANNDSIVDVPYSIEGDAENSDLHPMAAPDIWIYPWFAGPCGCDDDTTTTTTGDSLLLDPLILTAGISTVVVILVVAIFVKRR